VSTGFRVKLTGRGMLGIRAAECQERRAVRDTTRLALLPIVAHILTDTVSLLGLYAGPR
jgi:hypothetical protein